MTYKKKLIEVALPLATINAESAREKSIRHGHPSTLHLWWARRPLAAARAVLWARSSMIPLRTRIGSPPRRTNSSNASACSTFSSDLSRGKRSRMNAFLAEARAEIEKSCNGELTKILDPFGGGGAIPLEALRLGLPTYTGDLNPVAVLIQRAMLQIPSRFAGKPPIHPDARSRESVWEGARGLAADVQAYGEWMRDQARERIGHYYPDAVLPNGSTATPIAWIWAVGTVTACSSRWSGHVPLCVLGCSPRSRASRSCGSSRLSIGPRRRSVMRFARGNPNSAECRAWQRNMYCDGRTDPGKVRQGGSERGCVWERFSLQSLPKEEWTRLRGSHGSRFRDLVPGGRFTCLWHCSSPPDRRNVRRLRSR